MNEGNQSNRNIDGDNNNNHNYETNRVCSPMKTQTIAIGNGHAKSATNFRLVMQSLKLFSSVAFNLVAVVLVIGCLANNFVLARAEDAPGSSGGGYVVHKHDTNEKIKIGNAKTTNYNFQGSHYLPTQLTQVVVNVPKIKTSRTDRNPTAEEDALKKKIVEVYQEAGQELGASDHAIHFSHLGKIIKALNPKYIATDRVYNAVYLDNLVPLPEMPPEYFQLNSTADPTTIPVQLDLLNLKFREYFGWDQAFINMLASFDDDLLSPDQLAFKRLLMCLSQPELCGLAGLDLHKPAMFDEDDLPLPPDSDSESEHDEEELGHPQEAVAAASAAATAKHPDGKDDDDDDDDDEDDDDDDDDDDHAKSDHNSVARAFLSYGNGVSPGGGQGPSIQASAYAGSGQQEPAPEQEPEQPTQQLPPPPMPQHNPYYQSSLSYPIHQVSPPPAPLAQQQQRQQPGAPVNRNLYSDNENHYQKLGAAAGYSPSNIYAQHSKNYPYSRSNSVPSNGNKYASAIFTPPTQQFKQQKPSNIITSLLTKRLLH